MKRYIASAIFTTASVLLSAGCDLILGLKEATLLSDAGATTTTTGSGGAGGMTATGCTAPADCPSGPNGQATCMNGVCGFVCTTGFADCDGATGCEVDTTTKDNCGECGVTCLGVCESGSCRDTGLISAAYAHTCAIRPNGLWCWGLNQEGELGDGTTTTRLEPTKVSLPSEPIAVAGGGAVVSGTSYSAHTCTILADKSLMCWGSNGTGELGVGDNSPHTGPRLVPLPNVIQVSVGGQNTCAVVEGHDLYCWGRNNTGQVGNNKTSTTGVLSPTLVASAVAVVAVGVTHTCAIRTSGDATCWGAGTYGQLGNGGTEAILAPGVKVLSNALDISTGQGFSCARTGVGVFCWGKNDGGQLGAGDTMNRLAPQPVDLPGAEFVELGNYHAGAVVGPSLYMWGANNAGQLGDGTGVNALSPKLSSLTDVTTVSLGEQHTCALTKDHSMYCWGKNENGQLGDGTQNDSSSPVKVAWP